MPLFHGQDPSQWHQHCWKLQTFFRQVRPEGKLERVTIHCLGSSLQHHRRSCWQRRCEVRLAYVGNLALSGSMPCAGGITFFSWSCVQRWLHVNTTLFIIVCMYYLYISLHRLLFVHYILVRWFLYMMCAPVHGHPGAYFGMQGRSVQGWHCNPSNSCGMLFLVSNVFCVYNAVGCTPSRSAWWLVRSVVPTPVDVMSKKGSRHQGAVQILFSI